MLELNERSLLKYEFQNKSISDPYLVGVVYNIFIVIQRTIFLFVLFQRDWSAAGDHTTIIATKISNVFLN